MFNDSEAESVGFNSCWKVSKSSTDSNTQTKDEKGIEKQEQTMSKESKEVQTDELEKVGKPKFNEKALADFLVNICPKVEKELRKKERSQAFKSYDLLTDKESEENVTKLYTMPKPKELCDGALRVKVTALSWSCTGNVLAVACSYVEHSDWCNHSGYICLYNIERAGLNESTLSRTIETTSCVNSISMHPYEPSVIAAGTYSGEIIIWKLEDQDVNHVILSSDTESHHELVTQVEWVRNDASLQSLLVSAALDGQLMVWKGWPSSSNFKLDSRYVMGNSESSCEPGISCFGFSPNNTSLCVVAMEGGKVYHCELATASSTTRAGVSNAVKNPVVNNLETHLGTVTGISFSPYHERIVAMTGTDQQIKIYCLGVNKPQLIIWCDLNQVGLDWTRSQANMLAVWGGGGEVILYDTVSGKEVRDFFPAEYQQEKNTQPLTAVQFNRKRPHLLAVGNVEGFANIWKIPTKFSLKKTRI